MSLFASAPHFLDTDATDSGDVRTSRTREPLWASLTGPSTLNSHNLLDHQNSISAASPLNLPKEPPSQRVRCKLALSDPKTMSTLSARDHVAATERFLPLPIFNRER